MKTFREFLESEAPASVDNNVGKPVGGKKQKDDDLIQRAYKTLGDDLEAIDTKAKKRREEDEQTPFQEIFQSASDELKAILGKK